MHSARQIEFLSWQVIRPAEIPAIRRYLSTTQVRLWTWPVMSRPSSDACGASARGGAPVARLLLRLRFRGVAQRGRVRSRRGNRGHFATIREGTGTVDRRRRTDQVLPIAAPRHRQVLWVRAIGEILRVG